MQSSSLTVKTSYVKSTSCYSAGEVKRELEKEVIDYWDGRSRSYSAGVWDELHDAHYAAWEEIMREKLAIDEERGADTVLKVLDLGCGPGFFEILLSRMGCSVDAVDSSTQMLARARENVHETGDLERVNFFRGDIAHLPFVSDVYDAVISRNVTWLMKEPHKTYSEWRRVLKPGGKLLVFDANWYTYLDDPALDSARAHHQADRSILGWEERSFASIAQERRCEEIALQLPLTYQVRPGWDLKVLSELGFIDVVADETIHERVWNEGEQAFYATSPLFAIEAIKA